MHLTKNCFLMKKKFLAALAIAVSGVVSASAQAVEQPGFFDNWSIGLDGGVTSPLRRNPFFKSMRGVVGAHIQKQITPTFAIGAEGLFGINTSSWKGRVHSSTVFDNSYVGLYGAVDLFNLFDGYKCALRPFDIEAVAGAGWAHEYFSSSDAASPWNYFATKAGFNLNYNINDNVTVSLKPSVLWNMSGNFKSSNLGFNVNKAVFNFMASVTYHLPGGFECVRPYDQGEIDALNGEINMLRDALAAQTVATDAALADVAACSAALDSCMNRKPQVVEKVNNQYNSVRFVFFRIGSSTITADQRPNIEMIATYMVNHPKSKVVIKGYASKDGNYDFNIKLAQRRAEAVKDALMKSYKIPASRIVAEGEGIGNMFEEESWNRVSICTLDED